MSGPDRIWAWQYSEGARNVRRWAANPAARMGLPSTEYVRRDPAVLAALPEVQALITQLRDRAEKAEVEADFFKSEIKLRNKILDLGCVQTLIAGAFEAAAQSVEGDLSEFDHPSINYTFGLLADKIRALTPAAAIVARDAMIAEAAAKEREACAELAASSTVPSQTAMRLSAAIRKRGDV